jgi:hypothetical protein
MKRARTRLDLLPLLDVFMVVLFVFATIQEQQVEVTTQGVEAERERAAALESELAEAQARLAADPPSTQTQELREELRQRDEALAELRAEVRGTLDGLATGDDAIRERDVLAKLLDRYSVFEIEIDGEIDDSGAVVNHCCFRDDPLGAVWQSCADVPVLEGERGAWLDTGAGGLVAALRRTKGGNAMTIVRQDTEVSHGAASLLAEQLRSRFPDRTVDVQTAPVLAARCVE